MAIKKIVVVGNVNITSEEIQRIGEDTLNSKYIGLFSKRNVFLYPKNKIEESLLSTYPRISAVAIETESLEILNIKIKERDAVSIWCAAIQCYLVDENGYIFAEYHESDTADIGIADIRNTETDSRETSVKKQAVEVQQKQQTQRVQQVQQRRLGQLPKLYGGDQFVGPEPIGKTIFTEKLYLNIRNTIAELEKIGLMIDSVHVYSRDEIVFTVSGGGKLIFSDRKPFEVSLEDLKSSLKSSVFNSPISSSSSSSVPKISLSQRFEYIDVRFGNKVFYKMDKTKAIDVKTSSTTKTKL